ncbi:MAG: glycosyl hydrolase 115 family protein [Lachnospiraceae bacterium]|nr:glycosyl hydrolase 115 family protein [Lachnospiraceae bacterium]
MRKKFELVKDGGAAPFIVEETAYEGVRRIADKAAEDVEKVSGTKPDAKERPAGEERIVLCATLGHSPLIDELVSKGKLDVSAVSGKWETYVTQIIPDPFAEPFKEPFADSYKDSCKGSYKDSYKDSCKDSLKGVKEALVICGSDKRGTIYGIFSLSEYIGVSPLCYWGDAEPVQRTEILVGEDFEKVSKEPSVKYRGFFINDEWPCFGNWTFSHFGGFTSEMYEHVFELLLRLKGNYLWPAMWTSCFALDGPGSLNEELADLYGVVVGNSHHEPCLRAGEEFEQVKGEDSVYGNEWNFFTNREGLIRFWEDGLKRSGKFEHVITIGIRGERDSAMLGDGATLQQNIDLLKDVITVQKRLISEIVEKNGTKVPKLLALYKEVESFFYGKEGIDGLKDWDGMQDIICMLCEDNYGFMRSLPTAGLLEQLKEKNCGLGMYYHLDYHGAPVSYEWMPSTPLSKVWEQMCMAYDYGVRDVWIVNAGDLKGNEAALGYFLALAYDYDTWGSSHNGSWTDYLDQWFGRTFASADENLRGQMKQVLTRFMDMNAKRRPEALHTGVYHPSHYLETDRMLEEARQIEEINESVYAQLSEEGDQKALDAYYSMIYYPAKISVNLLRMHLFAGKNAHYALQGRVIANEYGQKVTECIRQDKALAGEFAAFKGGKWKGMELEQHIGFTAWNEDNCRYPLRIQVEPYCEPRLSVSRKDSEEALTRIFQTVPRIVVDDFLYEGNTEVTLELANAGSGELSFEIFGGAPWLRVVPDKGTLETLQEVKLICDRKLLPEEKQTVSLRIQSSKSRLTTEKKEDVEIVVSAAAVLHDYEPMTFLPDKGVVVMEAHHFCKKNDTEKGRFLELNGYGRSGHGMKVFPFTAQFAETEQAPSLTYRFLAGEEGEYQMEVWLSPTNPMQSGTSLRFSLESPDGTRRIVTAVPNDFKAGDWNDPRWCRGVVDQIRVVKTAVTCRKGVQEITIGALEAGLILERILLYRQENEPEASYLGPAESYMETGIAKEA